VSLRALLAGVGLGVVAGIVLGRIFIVRRVRRLLHEEHTVLPSTRGFVLDAGGGQIGIMVERDVERYPEVGTPVAVVETGPSVLPHP
jgi:hypothetical protein